jgi:transcriptional regulator GlxA family with amidase domain
MPTKSSQLDRVSQVAARRKTLRVAMLAYPGIQVLDVMGPLEVFSRTARWLKETGKRKDDAYRVEIIAPARGLFRASSGLRLYADHGISEAGCGGWARCAPARSSSPRLAS